MSSIIERSGTTYNFEDGLKSPPVVFINSTGEDIDWELSNSLNATLPGVITDGIHFEDNLSSDESFSLDDFIAFSPSLAMPPIHSASPTSPANSLEMLFPLNSSMLPSEAGSIPHMVFYLSNSTDASFSRISECPLVQHPSNRIHESTSRNDVFQLDDSVHITADNELHVDLAIGTIESCYSTEAQYLCDHNYSMLPLRNEHEELNKTEIPDNIDPMIEEFDSNVVIDSVTSSDGNPKVPDGAESLSAASLNLTVVDFKLLEEFLTGGGHFASPGMDEVPSGSKGKRAKSRSGGVCAMSSAPAPPENEIPNYSEDELMDEDAEEESKRKYLERRKKNNIASKRSRQIRKMKYSDMEQKAAALEEENRELKLKIAKMEALTAQMKEALIERLKGVKC